MSALSIRHFPYFRDTMRFLELPAWAALRACGECDTLQQLAAEATLEDYTKIGGAQFWSKVEKTLYDLSGPEERNVRGKATEEPSLPGWEKQ
jgi:hypothetical protein